MAKIAQASAMDVFNFVKDGNVPGLTVDDLTDPDKYQKGAEAYLASQDSKKSGDRKERQTSDAYCLAMHGGEIVGVKIVQSTSVRRAAGVKALEIDAFKAGRMDETSYLVLVENASGVSAPEMSVLELLSALGVPVAEGVESEREDSDSEG